MSSIEGLHPAVAAAIPTVFAKWEGKGLPYMYTDSKGYVTTGTGNLIDPSGAALALPWTHGVGGPAASQAEIQAAFDTVKGAYPGTQSTASASLTDLRLSQEALDALMLKTIAANQVTLMSRYPNFANLPADAQLAIHSISWAWGPGFDSVWGSNGAAFKQAIAAKNYSLASQIMMAASQHEESINPGIIPRDQANVIMFANAAKNRLRPATLYYPGGAKSSLLPWALAAAGGIGGFLVGGPVGAAVGAGAVGGAPWAWSKVTAVSSSGKAFLPKALIPAALRGAVDPKSVQAKLNALGYTPALTVDGMIGPLSMAAIKWYQASKGLPQSGAVDTATRKALGV